MRGDYSNCSAPGRQTRPPAAASWSTIRRGSTGLGSLRRVGKGGRDRTAFARTVSRRAHVVGMCGGADTVGTAREIHRVIGDLPRAFAHPTRACLQPAAGDARVLDGGGGDPAVPREQEDQGADDRTDEARALVGAVPADQLAEPGGEKRAGDAEHGGEHEAGRVVRSGRQEACDDAGYEADEYDPEDGG